MWVFFSCKEEGETPEVEALKRTFRQALQKEVKDIRIRCWDRQTDGETTIEPGGPNADVDEALRICWDSCDVCIQFLTLNTLESQGPRKCGYEAATFVKRGRVLIPVVLAAARPPSCELGQCLPHITDEQVKAFYQEAGVGEPRVFRLKAQERDRLAQVLQNRCSDEELIEEWRRFIRRALLPALSASRAGQARWRANDPQTYPLGDLLKDIAEHKVLFLLGPRSSLLANAAAVDDEILESRLVRLLANFHREKKPGFTFDCRVSTEDLTCYVRDLVFQKMPRIDATNKWFIDCVKSAKAHGQLQDPQGLDQLGEFRRCLVFAGLIGWRLFASLQTKNTRGFLSPAGACAHGTRDESAELARSYELVLTSAWSEAKALSRHTSARCDGSPCSLRWPAVLKIIDCIRRECFPDGSGIKIKISHLGWYGRLLWHTIRVGTTVYPDLDDLAFQFSLCSRAMEPQSDPNLSEYANLLAVDRDIVDCITRQLNETDRAREGIPGHIAKFHRVIGSLASRSMPEARSLGGRSVAEEAGCAEPPQLSFVVSATFDRELERAMEELKIAYTVVFPVEVPGLTEPGRRRWLLSLKNTGERTGRSDPILLDDSEADEGRLSDIAISPVIIKRFGAPLEMLPPRIRIDGRDYAVRHQLACSEQDLLDDFRPENGLLPRILKDPLMRTKSWLFLGYRRESLAGYLAFREMLEIAGRNVQVFCAERAQEASEEELTGPTLGRLGVRRLDKSLSELADAIEERGLVDLTDSEA